MTVWASQILAEVQKIYPGATVTGGTGTPGDPALAGSIYVTAGGVTFPIGNGTPLDQVAYLVNQYAPSPAKPVVPVVQPPRRDPDPADNLAPFQEGGLWYRYSGMGMKVRCAAPAVGSPATVAPSIKPLIFSFIEGLLAPVDPAVQPLGDEAVRVLETVYGFVQGLKG